MKVLVIAPQPFFSERGTPIAVRRLVETLCADGHQVDLLTYPFGTDLSIPGLTIHRCGRFPGVRRVGIGFSVAKVLQDLLLLPRLFLMARPGRYEVVHAVEESIYPALLLRWRHRARVIYDMDSSLAEQLADSHSVFRPLSPLLRRLEEWAIRSAELVAPMCRDLASYAAELRLDDDAVVLHDVPVDTGGARPKAQPLFNGSTSRCRALYVGNLEAYQGVDLLIDAAAHLPEDSPIEIRVVGGPPERADRFGSIADQRGLADRIQFIGPRPLAELHDLLAEADILLSPRKNGGNTPMKIYSYMESGRAILATRLSTHTQVLDDSTALLVTPEASDMARGLLLLAEDDELRRDLGESAKQSVRRNYSLASFARRVRHLYGRSHRTVSQAPASGVQNRSSGWNGVDRRASGDRRSCLDRRAAPRAGPDRRVGERRAFA